MKYPSVPRNHGIFMDFCDLGANSGVDFGQFPDVIWGSLRLMAPKGVQNLVGERDMGMKF